VDPSLLLTAHGAGIVSGYKRRRACMCKGTLRPSGKARQGAVDGLEKGVLR
jgi:hypothetical protein